MEVDKGVKAILVPKLQEEVWFPLLLDLDLVNNIQGVRTGNRALSTVEVLKILGEVKKEPLEVICLSRNSVMVWKSHDKPSQGQKPS